MARTMIRKSILYHSSKKHRKKMKQNIGEHHQQAKISSCFVYRSPHPRTRLLISFLPSAGPAGMLKSPLQGFFQMKPANSLYYDTTTNDRDSEDLDDDDLEDLVSLHEHCKCVRFDDDSDDAFTKLDACGRHRLANTSATSSTVTTLSMEDSSSISSIPRLQQKVHENHHRPLAPAAYRRCSKPAKKNARRSSPSASKPFVRPNLIPSPLSSQSLLLAPTPFSPRHKVATKRTRQSMAWVTPTEPSSSSKNVQSSSPSLATRHNNNAERLISVQQNIAKLHLLISSCRQSLRNDTPRAPQRRKSFPIGPIRLHHTTFSLSSRSVVTV